MKNFNHSRYLEVLSLSAFLVVFFLYFFVLNRYHLSYLEQNQLFRFNPDYLAQFFDQPGGFITLLGAFFTQFFSFPWIAAIIMTLLACSFYLLSRNLFNLYDWKGIAFSFIPVVLLAALQSSHNYQLANTFGWLISLIAFLLYGRIRRYQTRYLMGITSFLILYYLAGVYSFYTLLLFVLHEILFQGEKKRLFFILSLIVISLLIPWLTWRFIMLTDLKTVWYLPLTSVSLSSGKLFFLLMALYYPLVMIVIFLFRRYFKGTALNFSWNLKHIIPAFFIILVLMAVLYRSAYDPKNELFLKIDASYQASHWNKVLTLSEQYPGMNQLVMYYTNLALFKTGKLPEELFNYKQSGTKGLWLEWKRNETAPFYGGEIFYHLGYNNEAYRWAFEAMEAKGLNPRSLKRLVLTSLINREYAIAGKFLNYLDQTLFYRKWAKEYQAILTDTSLLQYHPELVEKRNHLVQEDFISNISEEDIGLMQLLLNDPNNRMAFEYLMTSFLLNKNLEAFAANIYRLNELRYPKIPRHFEEALILYSGILKKNIVPEGYEISAATKQRFHTYAQLFAHNRNSLNKAAEVLYRDFGNTFWYYLQFSDNGSPTYE
jgi:hypothetical protein